MARARLKRLELGLQPAGRRLGRRRLAEVGREPEHHGVGRIAAVGRHGEGEVASAASDGASLPRRGAVADLTKGDKLRARGDFDWRAFYEQRLTRREIYAVLPDM